MTDLLPSITDYLLKATTASLWQILMLFAPLLLLALIMNYISGLNERLGYKTFGTKGYLILFGWLGTSVHELGHALFAVLFGHRITDMRLFKPDPETGTLGYVKHAYNPGNLYHQIGNFFIGIGPILMGTLMLALLSYLLFGINVFIFEGIAFSIESIHSFALIKELAITSWATFSEFIFQIFKGEQAVWWKVVVFVYALYAIGSCITLSAADLKTAYKGFFMIVVLLFLFNLATIWAGDFASGWISWLNAALSGFYTIMLLAITVNLVFLCALSGVWLIINLLKKQQ